MSANALRDNPNARKPILFPSSRVVPHEGNRVIEHDDDMDRMIESIRQHGQLIPGITGPHPQFKDYRVCYDGNRRCFACRYLGRDFLTLDLDYQPTEEEKLVIEITTSLQHKVPDAGHLASRIWSWMDKTQNSKADAAQRFSISPGYVTKLVKPYEDGIPALIDALKAKQIPASCAYFIAQLTPEQQLDAVPRCIGKKRDAVERICKEYRGKKKKQKPLELDLGGVRLTSAAPTLEKLKLAGEALIALINKAVREGITDAYKLR